ncbi:MAG: thymidine kinase [Paracoccaceae bacterium]|jgi:thymidine kinase|nr:thymidine kinase [Paracoccaceae bacterium]
MAKLHFHYSTMNAGKSTLLLQAAHNYKEMGMETLLLTADFDDRAENGKITSRIGISAPAELYSQGSNLLSLVETKSREKALACVLVDEAQWLSPNQVWQLAQVVDDLKVPVICYGLRVDFMGELFPGSAKLLAIADEMREVRTICHCGSKATMVVRKDSDGKVQTSGDQVQVGGNEMYFSLCRLHWRQAVKDK